MAASFPASYHFSTLPTIARVPRHGRTLGGPPEKTPDPYFAPKDKRIIYMAPGPSCDFDRDGRIDLLLPNWWIEDRSLLLKNETPGGNWLDVKVEGTKGVNRMGIGSKVRIYPAGKIGEPTALLGFRRRWKIPKPLRLVS